MKRYCIIERKKGTVISSASQSFLFIIMKTEYQNQKINASSDRPCIHCGKPDWCYSLGDLTVCNRDREPVKGWYKTSKSDRDGHYYYALENKKKVPKQSRQYWEYPNKQGEKFIRVTRVDRGDGSKKKIYQSRWNGHKWIDDLKGINRADIPVYRYSEIREAIARGETIYLVAGEKCADKLWAIGLAATTNLGGETKWRSSDTDCLAGAAEIVICPDRDLTGIKHGLSLNKEFPNAKWLYAPPSQFFWLSDRLPASQGLDIADWIDAGADKDLIKSHVTHLCPDKFSESLLLYEKPQVDEVVSKDEQVVEVEEIHTQKAIDRLYSDGIYISIHDDVYCYTGTHYTKLSTPREKRRIADWCAKTPVCVRRKWKYSYAKPETVNNIWQWVLTTFAIDTEEVNPPGINCLNGVLKVEWQGKKVSYELVEHNPEFYFTHVANFAYNPQADDRDCNRLLSALDAVQQKIFLRTIAASIDLPSVRKYQGRTVKALLCTGTGSNGKDTLREAVKTILGDSMSSASVMDFKQYDSGRKFPAAKIEHSKINWSSENSEFTSIDSLQGLKAAITGEDFDIEPKSAPEYAITPRTVFLFNCNSAPLINGGSEAIASRWAVLSFNKTFKVNADIALGELQADSRFRYDPEFLSECVCPALFNKILVELGNVASEGIDYSPCDGDLQKIQEDSNHLWQFVNDLGIQRSPGDRLYISDLWRSLEEWYLENGTLEYERIGDRLKKVWHEQPRHSDRNVTASNQVGKRIRELFPDIQIRRHTERDGSDRRNQSYLSGLILTGASLARHETTAYVGGARGADDLAILSQLVTRLNNYSQTERLTAITLMENYIQSQTDLPNYDAPRAPAHCVRDTARASDAPSDAPRDEQRSPTTNTQNNSHISDRAVESVLNVAINNAVVSPDYTSDNSSQNRVYASNKEIDWVKDKAGLIWNINQQDEEVLVGRQSGLRGYHKIRVEDCAEIHYKRSPQEVEV